MQRKLLLKVTSLITKANRDGRYIGKEHLPFLSSSVSCSIELQDQCVLHTLRSAGKPTLQLQAVVHDVLGIILRQIKMDLE